jgi:hypothetical protein
MRVWSAWRFGARIIEWLDADDFASYGGKA